MIESKEVTNQINISNKNIGSFAHMTKNTFIYIYKIGLLFFLIKKKVLRGVVKLNFLLHRGIRNKKLEKVKNFQVWVAFRFF